LLEIATLQNFASGSKRGLPDANVPAPMLVQLLTLTNFPVVARLPTYLTNIAQNEK